MKHIIFLILILVLGCKSEKKESAQKISIKKDTTVNINISEFNNLIEKSDTSIFISGNKFNLSYSAKLDTSKKMTHEDIFTHEGKAIKEITKGFNCTYTFTLKDKLGNIIFNQSLEKKDFNEEVDPSILTESDASLPMFLGYLEPFEAFVFQIFFGIPDSDIGGDCLIMLNKKGELIEKSLNNYISGTEGEIEISNEKRTILTCRKILNSNGKNLSIADNNKWQIKTKLLNDNSILVIQEFDKKNKILNAKIIDNFGNLIYSFNYNGYYETLGYNCPSYYNQELKRYFLLDEKLKKITIINLENPASSFVVDFKNIQTFKKDIKPNEKVFEIETEEIGYKISYDSLKKSMRMIQFP
jgi:hypothetical protein